MADFMRHQEWHSLRSNCEQEFARISHVMHTVMNDDVELKEGEQRLRTLSVVLRDVSDDIEHALVRVPHRAPAAAIPASAAASAAVGPPPSLYSVISLLE